MHDCDWPMVLTGHSAVKLLCMMAANLHNVSFLIANSYMYYF